MHDYELVFQAQARRQAIAREVTAIRLAQVASKASGSNTIGRLKHGLYSLAVASVRVTRKEDSHDSTGRTILAVD